MARRPVNINTASKEVLELLFTNLQIRNRNSRVTAQEAEQLASVIIESRPLAGFEDFLRRVVLPAGGLDDMPDDATVVPEVFLQGGGAFLDPWDAVAVYTNALNANDFSLEFSTMPVAFTSREVFDLELRAAVNARSGVERYSAVRETVELVVPQSELMSLWARQADFDEALRLTRAAPYWMTGPAPTTRFDPAGSVPPSRLWAQLGTYQGQLYLPGVTGNTAQMSDEAPTPERIFPSTEQD
ncbi:MAG: general secretion pathway protein GspK, partial [Planctomycetes bacterium]|nr:general secretion pathway protein GspK [Planctomycetota bacterium]